MSTRSTADLSPTRTPGTRRRRVRMALVGLLTAGMSLTSLTAGAAVLPSDARSASSPTAGVRLADWTGQPYGSDLPQGTTGPASPWSSSQGSTTSTVDSDPASGAESAGVVLINTVLTNTVLDYSTGAGAGTGIVLTADGQVLTNYHVVEGATSVQVTVASTGKSYTADVVGHSESGDVALLQLEDATGLTTATIDDDTVGTGDEVTAVGNAGGTGQLTAADGTVTGLEETITTTAESGVAGETLEGLIETDADVVAGDSGGPLLDDEGEVIGIDTAASSGSVIDGYAIPIQDALAVVAQVRTGEETGTVQVGAGAFLGVQVVTAPTADIRYGSSDGPQDTMTSPTSGATVADVVTDGPAAAAGLGAGDTITAIGGTAVTSAAQVATLLADHDPGDRVRLRWTDGSGVVHDADVALASSPVA